MTGLEMWQKFCQQNNIDEKTSHDEWKFCGGGPIADTLAHLVLEGTKTATASAKIAYDYEQEPIPQEGNYSVILFDNGEAACVIQTTKVSVVPFNQVSAEHAYKEGEDDRSLEKWREVHREAFTPDYQTAGLPFDEEGDCILEEFVVVFRNKPQFREKTLMNIRHATIDDLDSITAVETECFPSTEAATKNDFAERIQYYGNHFWLMFDEEKLVAFVDGFVTDEKDLTDEMYESAYKHNEHGSWQMIFGVNTLPAYRKHGYAGELIRCAINDAKQQGRKGLVLTCKERLVSYYAHFGFVDEGISDKSTHGNVEWHQMRLSFE